ncbi:MAG: hypothetical protein K8S18_21755 [Desulfobacula sp.]|nr:hypothetical protein [Desulfobacula sp.]
MLTLTNPWYILIMFAIVAFVIYYAKNILLRKKNDPTLLEKLRNFGIHPTIRKPPKPSGLKGGDTNNSQNNNP